jgi:hypothetical protein
VFGAPTRALLALCGAFSTSAASGAVVYTDIQDFNVSRFDEISVDLNEDGIDDFYFDHRETELALIPFGDNGVLGIAATPPDLGGRGSALAKGSFIGQPEDPFSFLPLVQLGDSETGAILAFCIGTRPGLVCGGEFRANDAYIGLQFEAVDGDHYAWLRFDSTTFFGLPGGTVREWAYESEPNVGIAAGAIPEPKTSMFVLVAIAAMVCRRPSRRS